MSPNGSILIGGNTATEFTVPNAWVLAVDPSGNGTCSNAGACALKGAGEYDDGEPRTADACDPKVGCVHPFLTDGTYCTAMANACNKGKCE